MKSHDSTVIPLCSKCHGDFHALAGAFKGMVKDELLDWHDRKLEDFLLGRRAQSNVAEDVF